MSGKLDITTKGTVVVETTKIFKFQIFARPRKVVDAFGKKVSWMAL